MESGLGVKQRPVLEVIELKARLICGQKRKLVMAAHDTYK